MDSLIARLQFPQCFARSAAHENLANDLSGRKGELHPRSTPRQGGEHVVKAGTYQKTLSVLHLPETQFRRIATEQIEGGMAHV